MIVGVRPKYLLILFMFMSLCGTSKSQEPDSNMMSALVYKSKTQYELAISKLNKVLEANPLSIQALVARGNCYLSLSRTNEAFHDFIEADKNKKGICDLDLARYYAITAQNKEAINKLEDYLKSNDKQRPSMIKLDKAFSSLEKTPEWKALWTQKWYSSYQERVFEAQYLIESNKYSDAESTIDVLLSERPDKSELNRLKGNVLEAYGEYSKAIYYYTKAIELRSSNKQILKERATSYRLSNRSEEALIDISAYLHQYPYDLNAYLMRASLLDTLGKFETAKIDIEICLRYEANNDTVQELAAKIYDHAGEIEKSSEFYTRLIEESPKNYRNFNSRGLHYMKNGKYREASEDFSMSLDLTPHNSNTYYYKGKAEYYRGNYQAACYNWQKAIQYGNKESIPFYNQNCK
jgi:tetratricopeptide (TPR) repeat protein